MKREWWRKVEYRCGHIGITNLRNMRPAHLRDCPECEAVAGGRITSRSEAEYYMPRLTGERMDEAHASAIRADAWQAMLEAVGIGEAPTFGAIFCKPTKASWWIERNNQPAHEIIEDILHEFDAPARPVVSAPPLAA